MRRGTIDKWIASINKSRFESISSIIWFVFISVIMLNIGYADDLNNDANYPTDDSTINKTSRVGNESAKGISEYYAKDFYRDKYAVSALKKIWFGNDTYISNDIKATAPAHKNMSGIYDLKYKIRAQNAYFVFNDASGWSNKSGSRRIDWEQEGLAKGEQIEITNDFRDSSDWISRAPGLEDWLPCTCLSSLMYTVFEPDDDVWPSKEDRAVLLLIQKTPDKNCTPYKRQNYQTTEDI